MVVRKRRLRTGRAGTITPDPELMKLRIGRGV